MGAVVFEDASLLSCGIKGGALTWYEVSLERTDSLDPPPRSTRWGLDFRKEPERVRAKPLADLVEPLEKLRVANDTPGPLPSQVRHMWRRAMTLDVTWSSTGAFKLG